MFFEKEFISEGSILRGRWYAASDSLKAPCIVMCHGTSATITMCLSDYALEFQSKGFNVFLYDHAGFGTSDGKNPLTINPWLQSRGIADAVTYVKSEDHAHNGKIILWGDSFAVMLVLVVSVLIEDLAGVVSFTASCGLKVLNFENPKESFERLKEFFFARVISINLKTGREKDRYQWFLTIKKPTHRCSPLFRLSNGLSIKVANGIVIGRIELPV